MGGCGQSIEAPLCCFFLLTFVPCSSYGSPHAAFLQDRPAPEQAPFPCHARSLLQHGLCMGGSFLHDISTCSSMGPLWATVWISALAWKHLLHCGLCQELQESLHSGAWSSPLRPCRAVPHLVSLNPGCWAVFCPFFTRLSPRHLPLTERLSCARWWGYWSHLRSPVLSAEWLPWRPLPIASHGLHCLLKCFLISESSHCPWCLSLDLDPLFLKVALFFTLSKLRENVIQKSTCGCWSEVN